MPKANRGGRAGRANMSPTKSPDGAIIIGNPRHIDTVYMSAKGWRAGYYKTDVLEATTDGNGNITFSYAQPSNWAGPSAKTNLTNYVSFDVVAGAVDGKTFGIDWSKVQSVSGQTYSIKADAKAAGLKWNGNTKRWER